MTDRTYRIVIAVLRALFGALGLRIDVRGAEHLPGHGPAVVVGNHTGYLDFAFVGYAATSRGRLVRFMAKESTFTNPVTGPLMRAMSHIPVSREQGAGAYRRASRLLSRGEVVGLFPEGTISRSWELKDFKPGAAALALEHRVPIIPVVAWGGHRVVTVDHHVSLRRGTAVVIAVGEPYVPAADDTLADVSAMLRERMQQTPVEARRTYPQVPRDDFDSWWLPASLGGTAPEPASAATLDDEALARAAERTRLADQRARARATRATRVGELRAVRRTVAVRRTDRQG